MKVSRWVLVLLLPAAAVALLLLAAVVGLVLTVAPPAVSAVALGILALLTLWVLFGRRGSSTILAGSEASLMGRQSSKEGLL